LNEPINIIDEATGGLLQFLLLKPGVQHLVNFHNANKAALSFQISGLTEYWTQQPADHGKTQLIIHYTNQNQEGRETHCIPYRSPSVVPHAVEWLCFRLFHLINQLH
jgi:hypothetical protein